MEILDRSLQVPQSPQVPPVPASVSPTPESSKHQNRRSRKSERPLPTKSLPASSVEAPSAAKSEAENASSAEQSTVQRSGEGGESIAPKPTISETNSNGGSKDGTENSEKPLAPASQLTSMSNLKASTTATPTSATAMSVVQATGISGVRHDLSPDGLQALLPGRVRYSYPVAIFLMKVTVNVLTDAFWSKNNTDVIQRITFCQT